MSRIHIPAHRDEAPTATQPALDKIQKALGFLPNLQRMMSVSPAVLNGWGALQAALATTLDVKTREAIALAVSEVHECDYCLAAHSWLSATFAKVPRDEIERNRKGTSADPKRAAATAFASRLVQTGGEVEDSDVKGLIDAGYTEANVLEIIALSVQFLMTNFINNALATPIDFPPAGQAQNP